MSLRSEVIEMLEDFYKADVADMIAAEELDPHGLYYAFGPDKVKGLDVETAWRTYGSPDLDEWRRKKKAAGTYDPAKEFDDLVKETETAQMQRFAVLAIIGILILLILFAV